MIIAVASGKGGTGKTTVSVNLAQSYGAEMQLLDCDVEEPNAHLFLKGNLIKTEVVNTQVPEIDKSLCDACGECSRICEFKAIASLGSRIIVIPEMCHSCGGCVKVCPKKAITEIDNAIGVIESSQAGMVSLIQGCLSIGVAMAPPLIRALKARIMPGVLTILDAPPGTSCPVIATIREADFVLLVTEPTPFGLHDLKLAVAMIRKLRIPFGVVINRVGIGDNRVHEFCNQQNIPVLLEIPDDRRIAEVYSRGGLVVEELVEYRSCFRKLLDGLVHMGETQ